MLLSGDEDVEGFSCSPPSDGSGFVDGLEDGGGTEVESSTLSVPLGSELDGRELSELEEVSVANTVPLIVATAKQAIKNTANSRCIFLIMINRPPNFAAESFQ